MKGVSGEFLVGFKVFERNLEGISGKVSNMFQECFKEAFKVL